MQKKLWLVTLITVLSLFTLSCGMQPGGGTGPVVVSTAEPGGNTEETLTSDLSLLYTAGDYVRMRDRGIGIQEVDFTEDGAVVTIVLENLSDKEITVNPLGAFSAKNSDDSSLDFLFWGCSPALNGALLPNERLIGKLCWKNAEPGMKINFDPYWLGNDTAQFQLTQEGSANVPTMITESVGQTFSVGDQIAVGNQEVMLTSVEITSNHTKFHMIVRNTSQEKVYYVSGPGDFTAKTSDGTKVTLDYTDCGPSMEGYLLPGDFLQGNICYPTGETLRLTYRAQNAPNNLVAWEADQSMSVTPPNWSRNLSWDVYGQSTTLDVGLSKNKHSIQMEQYTYADGGLQATFVITNTSDTSMRVSSVLNFGARNADGTNVTHNIFCGGTIDGEIPAGQTLRGNVCWNDVQPGAMIYYLYDVFGPGIVVWQVD